MIHPDLLHQVLNWLYWHTGTNGSGPWYGFWSGFGSDLGEGSLLLGVVALYKKHNCHTRRCLRIGKHPVDGTPYIVCAKCHPDIPKGGATLEHIHLKHREHKARSI